MSDGAADLSKQEVVVMSWLQARRSEMIDLLGDLVNTDSGTYDDKAGVDAAGLTLQPFFRGLEVDIIPHESFGDAIRATLASRGRSCQRCCRGC
jgi:glutamate carboxypeptidase